MAGAWDWVVANTWDRLYYNALGGVVGPTQNQLATEDRDLAIARASGVGVGGKTVVASPEIVKQRQAEATSQVDWVLKQAGAHPSQFDVGGVGLDTLWPKLVAAASIGLGVYFVTQVVKAFVSRRS